MSLPAGIRIATAADIAAALSASVENGGLILDESDLGADFFDLRTGLAAAVLQKFTHFRARLAIVVADAASHGGRFNELAYEHRSHNAVRFVATDNLARQWLAYNRIVKC